jgi:hypothetical protein
METKKPSTPRPAHPKRLNTPTCKPFLNTVLTCANSITNTTCNPHDPPLHHSYANINFIFDSITNFSTSAATSPLKHSHSTKHILSIFLLHRPIGGVLIAFLENISAPLTCEPGGSASNETCYLPTGSLKRSRRSYSRDVVLYISVLRHKTQQLYVCSFTSVYKNTTGLFHRL